MKNWFKGRAKKQTYRQEVKKFRLQRRAVAIFKECLAAVLVLSLIGSMAMFMIFSYLYLISHPYFAIREITIRGCKELTEKEILAAADVKTRQNIFSVSLGDVKKRIRTNPWIKEAAVGRELPDRLVIDLKERTAVSLVKKGSSFYLMDLDGVTFKKLEMTDDMDLPILTGYQETEKKGNLLMVKTIELLRYLSSTSAFPTVKNISEINGNERYGISIFTDTGLCLHLGFDNYESKFKRLSPVLVDLEKRNQKFGHLYIDLSDPVKITVQRRDVLSPDAVSGAKNKYKT